MPQMFQRGHFGELRRVFYENTGIDLGLCRSIDEFGKKIREHAALLGELAVPPLSTRDHFVTHPTPNWIYPTPIQGRRTKPREARAPGAPSSFKTREVSGEVVRFTGVSEGELLVKFGTDYEAFMIFWIKQTHTDGAHSSQAVAEIDTGDRHYQMKAWPIKFEERGLVLFKYIECN